MSSYNDSVNAVDAVHSRRSSQGSIPSSVGTDCISSAGSASSIDKTGLSLTPTAMPPITSTAETAAQGAMLRLSLSQAHLKPGHRAVILDHATTIDLYRENATKSNNPIAQIDFARFLLDMAKQKEDQQSESWREAYESLIAEAVKLCKKAASSSHPEAQFMLADLHERGLTSSSRKPRFERAFPLYMQASKHGHPVAAYRAAVCLENGTGSGKNPSRALQFYQKAAAAGHAEAMYRLGTAELRGELTLPVNPRNGIKWLKHACSATPPSATAMHDFALLHESGIEHLVFVDLSYAVRLLQDAAELGEVESMFRLGGYYEHGMVVQSPSSGASLGVADAPGSKTAVERDPRKSFEYYLAAAQRGHGDAMFGVSSWFLTGNAEAGVPQSDEEAFRWMESAAKTGNVKAYFALAYFHEQGVASTGESDIATALRWYEMALEKGDKRAAAKVQRLKRAQTAKDLLSGTSTAMNNASDGNLGIMSKLKRQNGHKSVNDINEITQAINDHPSQNDIDDITSDLITGSGLRKSKSENHLLARSRLTSSAARRPALNENSIKNIGPNGRRVGERRTSSDDHMNNRSQLSSSPVTAAKPRKLTEAELAARQEKIRRARIGEDACLLM